MAGMVSTGYHPAQPGMVWDPTRGGFMSIAGKQKADDNDAAEHAAATMPQYQTSPLGEVTSYNSATRNWDTRGYTAGSQQPSGATATRAAAPAQNNDDLQRKAAMQALISQVQNTPADTYKPAQIAPITTSGATGGSPYDLAGENAAYGGAKERTGLALQAAMRGLRSQMAQRGIVGSGIEGDKLEELYASGLGELGATDRQLAETRAGRAFTAGQSDTDRTIQQSTYNVGAQNEAGQFNADAARQRMELIARLTQLAY